MWKSYDGKDANENVLEEGYYWVNSEEGVVLACYHHWGYCFQNMGGDDEGMNGFKVTHYISIDKPNTPEENL